MSDSEEEEGVVDVDVAYELEYGAISSVGGELKRDEG
jgi:hypothetical protein